MIFNKKKIKKNKGMVSMKIKLYKILIKYINIL